MARTTATEVKEILDGCNLADAVVDSYITAANALVTKILGDDTDIGATLLEEVEKWFTAHMIASTLWRTSESEKVGETYVQFTGKWGFGLDSTPYGQMVKQLDITGKMASTSGKRAMSLHAIESFD